MNGDLPQTTRNFSVSEPKMFMGAQPRSSVTQTHEYSQMQPVGGGIEKLTADETVRLIEYKQRIEKGEILQGTELCDYKNLLNKASCWSWPGFKARAIDFSSFQKQLSPSAGGWCAFLSTFMCSMFAALVIGWSLASLDISGASDLSVLVGPMVWATVIPLICLIGTFCLCPPEINIWTHLGKFFFDKERFNENLGMHLGHIFGNAGWFVGFVLVWVVFEGYPGAYEATTAYVHSDYNIGRAFLTEALFTMFLVMGTLALSIIVPYWMISRQIVKEQEGLSYNVGRLVICLAEGVLMLACTFASWNVTGAALNLFRWLAGAIMNGSFNYEVANSWWIFPVAGFVGCVVGSFAIWAFIQLSGVQMKQETKSQ